MVNTTLAVLALISIAAFYGLMDKLITERHIELPVIPDPVNMWYCDGWNGEKYLTEKSMKENLK